MRPSQAAGNILEVIDRTARRLVIRREVFEGYELEPIREVALVIRIIVERTYHPVRRQKIAVVLSVEFRSETHLLQVAQADNGLRLIARPLQTRQKYRDEQSDDRHDYQDFDKREPQ